MDDAAFLNGTASHALDYDDVSAWVRGHPSTVLIPGLLAAALRGSTLTDLSESYAVGFEIGAMLVDALPGAEHYARGWHATATLGTIMTAAATARITNVNEAEAGTAIGLASSMASGIQQNFGSTAKPLHAGMAARNGVLAVSLASLGATADEAAIEGPRGFLSLYGNRTEEARAIRPEEYRSLLQKHGVNIKQHPCCYFTQHAVDAAVQLREEHIRTENILAIQVTVQPRGLAALRKDMPKTGLQGKFSMEYCVGAALDSGVLTLHDFSDSAVQRSEVLQIASLVECGEADIPPIGPAERPEKYAVVTITTKGGQRYSRRIDFVAGDARSPMTDEQFLAKATSCLSYAGLPEAEEVVLNLWESLQPDNLVSDFLSQLPILS